VDYDEHIHIIALSVKFARGRIRCSPARAAIPPTRPSSSPNAPRRLGPTAPCSGAVLQQADAGGLFQHFREWRAARACHRALQHSGRCGVEIGVDTVQRRLAQHCKNIVGIKEAGGNADRREPMRAALRTRFES